MHRNTRDTQEIHPWFPLFKISSWISIRRRYIQFWHIRSSGFFWSTAPSMVFANYDKDNRENTVTERRLSIFRNWISLVRAFAGPLDQITSQQIFGYSKSTVETLENGVK